MKAFIVFKARKDGMMYAPGSYKLIEGHDNHEIAKFAAEEQNKSMSPSERMVGWFYGVDGPIEIFSAPEATAASEKPIVD